MSDYSQFIQLYIQNIKNRIPAINNPVNEDKTRWPMELIQNAKDSLFSSTNVNNQDQVSITIEIEGELDNPTKVIFSHDGPPFTENSYQGLINQCSSKRDEKTTGKFGTGFFTTHVLSKIVKTSGDIIQKDNIIKGFSVELNREGKTDNEIENNYQKMKNSFSTVPQRKMITKFEYQTDKIKSKECTKLGITKLKNHMSNILINCSDIKCIKLIENGREIEYSASFELKENSILYTVTASMLNEKKIEKRKYLVVKNDDVSISVEIGDDYKIIPKDPNIEYIYVVFPLIGTESHILPFSINSSKFEPSEKRNSLPFLIELKNDEDTNALKNRNLILSSLDLYEKLICELLNNHCSEFQELAKGLKLDQCPYEEFDLEWYEINFLQKMRDILSKKVTVKSCLNESILLSEAFFPDKISDEQFFNLSVTKKYYSNMISYQDFMLWKDYIWKTPRMVSIEDLIEKVMNDRSLFEEPQLISFNEILSFLWKYDKNILHNHPLIPNMNNELICLSTNGVFIKECKKVSEDIIQIIESIEIPWKAIHVNNNIKSIQFNEDDNTDAENKIINKFNDLIKSNNDNDLQKFSYCLMKFVLKNDDKREKMFKLASKIDDFTYCDSDKVSVSTINPNIWNQSDDFVLKKIINIIQKYDNVNIKNEIRYIKEFIPIVQIHYKLEPEIFNSLKIIPNAKNELKSLKELVNKSIEFHDHFSPKIKEFFGKDLDEQIINHEINQVIKSEKDEKLIDFLNIIDENINTDEIDKFLPISELVLSVVPSNSQQQNEIYEIYRHFKPIEKKIIDDDDINLKYFNKSNKNIISKLCQFAEVSGSLQKFQDDYSLSEEVTYNVLNLLYSKLEDDISNHQIVPNKNGKFMYKKDLRIDPKIDKKYFDLCAKLYQHSEIPEDQQLNNPQKIVNPKIKIDGIENFDIAEFYKTLNKKIKEVISNPNTDHEVFKMIHECTEFDFSNVTSDSMSIDQKFKMDMLRNAHITFIKNKIRDLDSPKISDYQRWPFELIQNATDCIQDSSEGVYNAEKNGHMLFEFNDDEVVFEHYGAPFTQHNLVSLLYQYGGEKDGKSKIGKFGTGFLSTIVLSSKVEVFSDLYKTEDYNSIKGFHAVIDRPGKTSKELKSGIESMEKSLNTELDAIKKTRFVFKLTEKKYSL